MLEKMKAADEMKTASFLNDKELSESEFSKIFEDLR